MPSRAELQHLLELLPEASVLVLRALVQELEPVLVEPVLGRSMQAVGRASSVLRVLAAWGLVRAAATAAVQRKRVLVLRVAAWELAGTQALAVLQRQAAQWERQSPELAVLQMLRELLERRQVARFR